MRTFLLGLGSVLLFCFFRLSFRKGPKKFDVKEETLLKDFEHNDSSILSFMGVIESMRKNQTKNPPQTTCIIHDPKINTFHM